LTPPITPPEKRPDRHYDYGRMNMVFALSALGLLAVTLWMVLADYAQPWKRMQAEFRSLERQKLLREAEQERTKVNDTQLVELRQDVAQAEASLAGHRGDIDRLQQQIKDLNTRHYSADAAWKGAKAQLDAKRFQYDTSLQGKDRSATERLGREVSEARKRLADAKHRLEELEDAIAQAKAQLAAKEATVAAAQKKLDDLKSGVAGVEKRAAALAKNVDYFVLNAPLMDFVRPSLHIEQAILPGLTYNINFTTINRVDRCMTCHVAANRPGFDGPEWKEPFRTHPKLAVFVGDGSPHPYTRFGCTGCHGGLDRATDFARAGHSPATAEQRRDWEKRYGWERQKFLDNPILPAKLSEAGCVSCHSAGVWTASSPTQDVGRELMVHMGCFGCHTIGYPAYTGLRKAGPDLTRIAAKTNPGWAYEWIEAPRRFHPTTWMPHFFGQENTRGQEAKQRTEIAAIVSYLWAKSERRDYPPAPAGDAARGQQLFEAVGCAGCHVRDANATRDQFFPTINRLHGPNLVRTGSKVGNGWLFAWLKNPKQYFPETNMPNLRLTDQEAADLTAFVLSSRDPRYENRSLPAIDGKLRDGMALAYLQNNFTIDRSRAKLAAMSEAERNVYLGEQSIAKYGCYGCHTISGFENVKPIGTELTTEGSKPLHQLDFGHVETVAETRHDWIRTKLLDPRIWDKGKEKVKDYNELLKMPNFGMSEREADAVLANVLGFTKETATAATKFGGDPRTAALAEGRKLITRFNCQGCHLIEGEGHAIKSLIQDPAMLPPNLAAEGARVQADWLFSFLHDPSQVKMRPWLTVRMPTFAFSDDHDNALVAYFAAREARRTFLSAPPAADPRSLAVGQMVFTTFQCAKCHPAGAAAAQAAGGAKGDLAPSLLLAPGRLRYDWVPSWIKDPQGWVPGTRMPTFFPETEPHKFMSPLGQAIDSPVYAAQKQQLLRYFSSEAELKAFLSDVDKVTAALRDHIWSLSGGGRPAIAGRAAAPAAVAAGGR
jgi:cytochrome c2/phage shock protein A